MVMMSKPMELWAHLQAIAEKYSQLIHLAEVIVVLFLLFMSDPIIDGVLQNTKMSTLIKDLF